MSLRDWRKYVLGQSDRSVDRQKTAAVIREWVNKYLNESKTTMDTVENMKSQASAADSKREIERLDVVLGRWKQIQRLCEKVLQGLN